MRKAIIGIPAAIALLIVGMLDATRQKSVAIFVVDRVRIKSVVVKLEDAPAGYPCVLNAVSSMARGIVPVRLPNEGTIVHSNAALVALAREFGEGNLVMLSRVGAETAEHDALDRPRLSERREHGAKRDARSAIGWKAVSTSRDGGKGNRGKTVLARETEARTVAGGKQLVLAALAAAPNRTNGVDDVTREKAKARGDLGIPRLAAAELSTSRAKLGTCGTVDRTIHAASAKQRPVGGVDDGVDVEPGDVAFDDFNAAAHSCIANASKHEIKHQQCKGGRRADGLYARKVSGP